VGALK
jgi:hypothetical protein